VLLGSGSLDTDVKPEQKGIKSRTADRIVKAFNKWFAKMQHGDDEA
jgi:hypothetical protein